MTSRLLTEDGKFRVNVKPTTASELLYRVREARDSDKPQLRALLNANCEMLMFAPQSDKEIDELLDRRRRRGEQRFCTVAETANKREPKRVIGAVFFKSKKYFPESPAFGYIDYLAVSSHCIGRGIGSTLLEDTMYFLKTKEHVALLSAHLLPCNVRVSHLFRNFGFNVRAESFELNLCASVNLTKVPTLEEVVKRHLAESDDLTESEEMQRPPIMPVTAQSATFLRSSITPEFSLPGLRS